MTAESIPVSETTEDGADLAPDDVRPDAAEEAFEQGTRRRESAAREENKVKRALRQRAEARAEAEQERRERLRLEAELAELRAGQTDADVDTAEMALRDAVADGDADRIAKAHRKLAEATANAKAARIVAEQEAARRQAEQQPQRPQMDPAVEDWCESNAHWFKPQSNGAHDEVTALALIANQEAIHVKKLRPGTPAYFAYIERRVEAEFPGTISGQAPEGDEPEPQPAPRRPVAGAAPVSARPAATARPAAGVQKSIRLTQQQLEMAKSLGIPPERYAARIQALGAGAFKDPSFMGLTKR